MSDESELTAPSKALFMLEGLRSAFEFGLIGPSWPLLRAAPRGDGHAVMVMPGMATSDVSTVALRLFLRERGYAVYGWGAGRNVGSTAIIETLRRRLTMLRRKHDVTVSLIGISLGGVYARELAKLAPELVRCVITLASPFKGPHRASNVFRLYEFLSGRKATELPDDAFAHPPPLPTTAIYTRSDGIVAWQRCVENAGPRSESIEVIGSHSGLGHNALALYVVADRLAQPEGRWQAFRPPAALRRLYRIP